MPKSWTQAIDQALGRVGALRDEVAGMVEAFRRERADVPVPVPSVDPAPLIAEAEDRTRIRFSQHKTAIEEATRLAQEAKATAEAALSEPKRSVPEQILTVFKALARILAVRLLFFLSLAGTFSLALMAMTRESWMGMALTVAFAVLTIGPLAWLETAGRAKKNEEVT